MFFLLSLFGLVIVGSTEPVKLVCTGGENFAMVDYDPKKGGEGKWNFTGPRGMKNQYSMVIDLPGRKMKLRTVGIAEYEIIRIEDDLITFKFLDYSSLKKNEWKRLNVDRLPITLNTVTGEYSEFAIFGPIGKKLNARYWSATRGVIATCRNTKGVI